MKLLILGENGQLASEFKKITVGNRDVRQAGRADADFQKPDEVVQIIRDYKPTHIINAAAYTAVDKAESEKNVALHINGIMPGIIGEVAKKIQASVTHFSTDYVFAGTGKKPYVETDKIDPVNYYGLTKSVGDKNLADSGCQYQIFRVSWVYGAYGHNFLKTMLKLGQEKTELKIVSDQIGAPTTSLGIASLVWQILQDRQLLDKSGTYHMTPFGKTNWHEFATHIFELAQKRPDRFKIICKSVLPISSAEFISAAKRPQYSLMSSAKLKTSFNVELPEWDENLKLLIKTL